MGDKYALASKQNFVKKRVVGSHSVGQTNSNGRTKEKV